MAEFRFKPGDTCYVRKWPVDSTVLISKGFLPCNEKGMPMFRHYLCVSENGDKWTIPEIDLSSTPIVEKK